LGTAEDYPRFEAIRESFEEGLRTFAAFVAEGRLGRLTFKQCEVTYVNHIAVDHASVARLFALWRGQPQGAFLPPLEDAMLTTRFVIPDQVGRLSGRLTVTLQPAYTKPDSNEIQVLTLTARGRPTADSIEGAVEFLNVGREWIVRGFADLTTPEMHDIWGRRA
jgi:uncharacterized protein (TIGR04255 family)